MTDSPQAPRRSSGARETRVSGRPTSFWEGDPAESIIEASIAEGADIIMLGSRPRTNLRRLILGSVSSEVAKRATCQVVVVPN